MFENSAMDNLFPHRQAKGTLAFEKIEEILYIKALFNNLDTKSLLKLWERCEYEKFEPINITRLSTVENQGFKIHSDIKKSGLVLTEYSPYKNRMNEQVFFDISESNLPKKLGRNDKVKKFSINDYFINQIITNYGNNKGYELLEHSSVKTALDFDNRIIFYPKIADKKRKLGGIISSVVTAEIIQNQQRYNQVLQNPKIAASIKLKVRLVTNAIFNTLGLEKRLQNITADDRKNFVWGANKEQAFANINNLIKVVGRIMEKLELNSTFYKQSLAQENFRKNYSTTNKVVDITEKSQALYNERGRVMKEIERLVSIEEVIEDFSGNRLRKQAGGFVTKCISPEHEDTKPSMTISPSKGLCQCFSCGFGANMYSAVQTIMGVDFKEAVDLIAKKYDIKTNFDFIEEQFSKELAKGDFLNTILINYKEFIKEEDKSFLMGMDLTQLKNQRDKFEEMKTKSKVYSLRERNEIDLIKEKTSYVVKDSIRLAADDILTMNYLKNTRGFKRIPKELVSCKVRFEYPNEPNKKPFSQDVVGFLNEQQGIDGKTYQESWKGKPFSAGNKDLTILGKENLNAKNPIFIVSESQWDLVAFYNDDKCYDIYEKSVKIITNGASNATKATDYINKNKEKYSGIVILNQADYANESAMFKMLCGVSEITAIAQVRYKDDEIEQKKDVNDLLKDGEDIHKRFVDKLEYIENRAKNKNKALQIQ